MNNSLRLLLATVVLATSALAQTNDTVVEEIVARVNNSIITRADLRRSHEQMVQEVRQQSPQKADEVIAEREKTLLRDLIDQQLLVQRGQDLGINADTDLVKRLDDLRKELGAASLEDLEKMAEQQGVSFEDFKQNMKNNIITQRVIGQEVGGRLQITKQEIEKYYEEHKADFDLPERVRLSEILIAAVPPQPRSADDKQPPAQPDPTPEQLAAAEAKANEALAQLKAGKPFAEIARKYSNGPTAEQGGDLGFFKRGMLAKELEDKTFALKPKEFTEVIRTKQGFVILEATEHTEAGLQPLQKVTPYIQEQIYFQKMQPAMRAFLQKLREEAFIDVKQGYVDAGATPGQSKPVFTAANEEPKEEQKKKRKRFLLF
ncbi:MAG TPA: peptidylprolyl isomerase [Clostridia bacterium]|nr:peptidylprolyl isomerase [Clostridia bacterium]